MNFPEIKRVVRWLGNAARDRQDMYDSLRAGAGRYVGPPAATEAFSSERLAALGLVGIYVEEVADA